MTYKILLYCPDDHITYNLHTLDQVGVGGGVTARIRLAHALANLGHHVSAFVNCPQDEIIQGVQYHHFSRLENSHSDIAIFSSSGGNSGFQDLSGKTISAQLRILMVHGVSFPMNISSKDFDFLYAISNFIRGIAISEWGIDAGKVFVSYHGVVQDNTSRNGDVKRDPFKLVYFGHPSKGLDAAIQVLKILQMSDSRFSLHVFGGNQLWGMPEESIPAEPGVFYYGLIGQKELAARLPEMSFSLNLQSREEPFGMVVTESMQAGCIVLASPVGAYPEIISNGWNGFLIPGSHSDANTHKIAARKILEIVDDPIEMNRIRSNAASTPHSWDTIARAWVGHWDWVLGGGKMDMFSNPANLNATCTLCSGPCLSLADGQHCLDCGNFQNTPAEKINLYDLVHKWDY